MNIVDTAPKYASGVKSQINVLYITVLTLVATLGGLLFGYDTAVISGAEKSIQQYLIIPQGFSALVHGATISSALIGCVIGGSDRKSVV